MTMTRQQIENVERVLAGLTVRDKQELIKRIQRSIQAERPGALTQTKVAKPDQQKKPTTEQELLQHMLEIGLMTSLPDTESDFDDPDDQPIDIPGEPLSETIIRERR